MKRSVRLILTLVLCLALSLLTALIGVPAAKTADMGNWTPMNTGLAAPNQNVNCFAINPATPTTLYAGTTRGVFRSTDSGGHWVPASAGLTNTEIQCLAIDPVTPTILYAGMAGGVFRSTDSGTTWIAADTGLANTVVCCLVINPPTPTTLYAAISGYSDAWPGDIFRSTDSGATWTAVNPGVKRMYVQCLVIDPLTPTTLYAGTGADGLFRSTDAGDHWTAVNTGLTDTHIHDIVVNPATPTTLYVGTSWGVFRSMDQGDHWTAVNGGLGSSLSIGHLAIDPVAPSTVYGTVGRSVFRSMDAGTTWWTFGQVSEIWQVHCLAISPVAGFAPLAGTEGGVFHYNAISLFFLTTKTLGGGSVKKSPDAPFYTIGTVVTITATPAPGHKFTGWLQGLGGKTNPVTITMNNDLEVIAGFDAVHNVVTIKLKIGSKTMLVDGKSVALEAAPVILNSRTLLPIRAVVEATGGVIDWDASAQKVTILRNDKKLELWIGRNVAQVNNLSTYIDSDSKVVPIIKSGRTLLPLRFVAEALALDVQWDAATKTITITYTS